MVVCRVLQIVVENEVFDALLFGSFGFLLRFHCQSKVGVRREVDRACLEIVSKVAALRCQEYVEPGDDFLSSS